MERKIKRTVIPGQQSVISILGDREKLEVDIMRIMQILPHRGRMLLLDGAIITGGVISGYFKVDDKVCEGHEVLDGKQVFKGSDFCDMAAQLMGVWAFFASDQFLMKLGGVATRYEQAEFKRPTVPNEMLIMEIKSEDLEAMIVENNRGKRVIYLTGMDFVARVGDDIRATVLSVEAVAK